MYETEVWLLALGTAVMIGVGLAVLIWVYRRQRRQLEKIPVTDKEKREAVEMTLRGVVFCVLGLLFPPLVLFGLAPLYYGLRKLSLAQMGVGLLEDPREGPASS